MSEPTTMRGMSEEDRDFPCAECGGAVRMTVTVLGSGKVFGLPDQVLCPDCRMTKQRQLEVLRQEEAAERRQLERRQAVERAVARLATPRLFVPARIQNTERLGRQAESNRRIDRAVFLAGKMINGVVYDAPMPPLLNFHGQPGSGKTRMLYAIANELAGQYCKSVRVVKLSQLIRDLRAPWRSKAGPDEQERLDGYVRLDFLGIDEVSRHAFYGQSIEQHLWDVINGRLEACRPTVLTSNETPEEVEAIVGAAITSRLKLGGHVAFPDEDFRPLQPREWADA